MKKTFQLLFIIEMETCTTCKMQYKHNDKNDHELSNTQPTTNNQCYCQQFQEY